MTRLQKLLGMIVIVLASIILGAAAYAAVASGPPVTSPPGTAGPYYSGPVHECVSAGNENTVYVEEHSDQVGNCAAGYRQLVVNELTPAFTLELNGAVLQCSADTAGAETALKCPAPPVPSSSPASSTPASPAGG